MRCGTSTRSRVDAGAILEWIDATKRPATRAARMVETAREGE
jgi:hypothetical protein